MRITCAGNSDVGVVRSGNEDNFLLDCAQGLFIVADGMGGHAAGEVASEMAVNIVSRELGSLRGLPDGEAASRLRTAIRRANGAIFERTLAEHEKRGMGTTATVMVLLLFAAAPQAVRAQAIVDFECLSIRPPTDEGRHQKQSLGLAFLGMVPALFGKSATNPLMSRGVPSGFG